MCCFWPRSDPSAGATSAVAVPGLVAAYSFDEGSGTTVADASGSGNGGTASGTTWTSSGKFGSALVFNGSSARVTVPDSASLRLTTGMTLEAWVYPTTVSSAWRDVIYKANDNYYLEGTSDNASRPGGGGTFLSSPVYGTAALTANSWSHLALTYDKVTLRLYVNGVQVASAAATANIATSSNPLQIGGDDIYGQFFSGRIDEVRIYNRALSATEVQTDMNTPVGGTVPPPVDTQPPTAPSESHGECALEQSDQLELDGLDGQRRGDQLPGGTLSGSGLLELRTDRDTDGSDLQRQWSCGEHALQLPRARDRCGHQPQCLLHHR